MSVTTGLIRATVMVSLICSALGAQDARGAVATRRLSSAPILRMSVYVRAAPKFDCSNGEACVLSAIVVWRTFPMPHDGALFDSTDQKARVAEVMRRTDESWRFQVAHNGDTTTFGFSSDSLQFVYRYDPRREFGVSVSDGPQAQISTRAEIRDPAVIAALRKGRSLRVLTNNPTASSEIERTIWLSDATRWLRRVQQTEHEIAATGSPLAGDKDRASVEQP